jgi:hypothetical protein
MQEVARIDGTPPVIPPQRGEAVEYQHQDKYQGKGQTYLYMPQVPIFIALRQLVLWQRVYSV